jgi:hypothetical protein
MWHLWLPLQHWLAIHTGTDNESSGYYGFFSGFGSDISELVIIGGLYAFLRRHNCSVLHCWRLGRHVTAAGHYTCRKHSPEPAPTHAEVIAAHKAAKRHHHGGSDGC